MTDALALSGFHDSSLSPEERWVDYEAFTHTYVDQIKELVDERGVDFAPNNMASVIIILDGERTLGGRAEELLARSIGIPPEEPVISAESFRQEQFLPMTETLFDLGASAITITTLPHLPHYFEGAIITRWPVERSLPERGGFRRTGLSSVLYRRDERR